jgi:hypothetical protein
VERVGRSRVATAGQGGAGEVAGGVSAFGYPLGGYFRRLREIDCSSGGGQDCGRAVEPVARHRGGARCGWRMSFAVELGAGASVSATGNERASAESEGDGPVTAREEATAS